MAFKSARQLVNTHATLRPPIVNGLVRRGEVFDIVGLTKSRKSWMMQDLALSVASGQPFLGKWEVTKGPVLIIDAELHPEVLAQRIPMVAEAKGIDLQGLGDNLCIETLRGQNQDIYKIKKLFDSIKDRQFDLILIDPLFRLIPTGVDENSNSQIGQIFNQLDAYAAHTGAAIGVSHHATKGNQAGKSVVDVGAGAGSMARSVDCHMVVRQHQETDCAVLEIALRSWPPVPATAYRWEAPLWKPADELDPSKLLEYEPWWKKKRDAKYGKDGTLAPKKPKNGFKTSTEINELVKANIPAGEWVDTQELCFILKDVKLSDRQVYRSLNYMRRHNMVDCRPGEGSRPALFRQKEPPPPLPDPQSP
jgi:hypothetical protein